MDRAKNLGNRNWVEHAANRLLKRRTARASLGAFCKFVQKKYVHGRHLDLLDAALERVEKGECKRLIISMPPRHGKSQKASIHFPAWCLGRNPEKKIVVSSYGSDLAKKMSRDTQRIVDSKEFRELFPETGLSPDNVRSAAGKPLRNVDEWEMINTKTGQAQGGYKCVGVGGALTGHGGDVLIVDDFAKNRADANSIVIRNATLDWYRSTLRTRLAPGGSIIIIATRWHPDDLIGKLLKDSDGEQWETIFLPAIEEKDGQEVALWPERWPLDELKKIKSAIGRYEWSALYQGNPVVRGGNIFQVQNVKRIPVSSFPESKYIRAWDLASTSKQRANDDPDYTVGTLATVIFERDKAAGMVIPKLYVRDVSMFRSESPARNEKIRLTAMQDGQGVNVAVEAFGAYKDAANELKNILAGLRIIREVRPPGDKVAKAAPLEPIFEAGNVFVPEGAPWVDEWLRQFEEFPSGAHDDAVDSCALVYHEATSPKSGLILTGR